VNSRPSTTPAPDVIVIGGGVIGASIAYACTAAGMRVCLIERNEIASGASGAAAGMLAPQVEAHQPDDFFDLCLQGRSEYAQVAPALLEEAGIDIEYRKSGILRVALEEREAVDLQGRAEWQRQRGLTAEWLAPSDVAVREPMFAGAISRRIVGALWLPEECQVRSPRLVRALLDAAIRKGTRIREGTPVLGLVVEGNCVSGVRLPGEIVIGGAVVVAAGAWSAEVARYAGVGLRVEPIKGQILALSTMMRSPRHILWSGTCYVAPKVDGQLVIGATEERSGFDPRPTMSGLLQLAMSATEMLPELGRLPINTQWGGLRPATPDRLPVIGWAPALEGLFFATGHFRNGVLLGPLTGRIAAAMLAGEAPCSDVASYAPGRVVERAAE
jgi:glycine oxidase